MAATGQISGAPVTITKRVETDLSAKENYLVAIDTTDGDLIALATGATQAAWVLMEGVDGSTTDAEAAIAVSGVVKVKLGGTVSAGNKLTPDSNGKAVATSTNAQLYSLTALDNGVDGDVIAALVTPGIV